MTKNTVGYDSTRILMNNKVVGFSKSLKGAKKYYKYLSERYYGEIIISYDMIFKVYNIEIHKDRVSSVN